MQLPVQSAGVLKCRGSREYILAILGDILSPRERVPSTHLLMLQQDLLSLLDWDSRPVHLPLVMETFFLHAHMPLGNLFSIDSSPNTNNSHWTHGQLKTTENKIIKRTLMGKLWLRCKNQGREFKERSSYHNVQLPLYWQDQRLARHILWEQCQGKPNKWNHKPNLHWLCQHKQCTVWLPYNKLRDLLTDPSCTQNLLTPDHHHLLFKHFAALEPGTADAKGTH